MKYVIEGVEVNKEVYDIFKSWKNKQQLFNFKLEQENEQLKAENLQLGMDAAFCDKATIEQLLSSDRLLRNDRRNQDLIILTLKNEITKMNKGMGRKNRKIARLRCK